MKSNYFEVPNNHKFIQTAVIIVAKKSVNKNEVESNLNKAYEKSF